MAINSKKITISQGITFQGFYSWVGLALLALSGYLFSVTYWVWIAPMALVGLVLFLQIKQVEIDLEKQRLRFTTNYLFFKSGGWQSLKNYQRIELSLDHETLGSMNVAIPRQTTVKTFDISLVDRSKNSLLLKDFGNYQDAAKMLHQLSGKLQMESTDRYRLARESAQKKRHSYERR